MSFLKKLADMFSPPRSPSDYAYWVTVRCSRCGEEIRSRVDLRNDLSIEYGDNGAVTYFCRKGLVGEKCYQQIEVEMTFDANHKLIEQSIQGGKFITQEEYEASAN